MDIDYQSQYEAKSPYESVPERNSDTINPHSHQQSKAIDKYEIHITIEPDPNWGLIGDNLDRFVTLCDELRLHPLYIENYTFLGAPPLNGGVDILTSSEVETPYYPVAYRQMIDIVAELQLAGFKVIRRKIECQPSNWRVANMWKDPDTYFEAHIGIKDLGSALSSKLPISRNRKTFFNPLKVDVEMVTFRRSGIDFAQFRDQLNNRLGRLNYDMGAGGVETEFCMFDDNIQHDDKWFQNYGNS